MSESIGQVLLQLHQIITSLAIGLTAVIFAVYAISVTYLKEEKWETEKENKKRMDKLKQNIAELNEKLSNGGEYYDAVRKQLENSKSELEGTTMRYYYLTAKGGVRRPLLLLIASLGFSFLVNVIRYGDMILVNILSSIFLGLAFFNLYKTVQAVEYASSRPARTVEFIVNFYEQRNKNKMINAGLESPLKIIVYTIEQEIENLDPRILLPPAIEVVKTDEKWSYEKYQQAGQFAGYTEIYLVRTWPKLVTNRYLMLEIMIKSNKTGRYEIIVTVNAKGIYTYTDKLILDVI